MPAERNTYVAQQTVTAYGAVYYRVVEINPDDEVIAVVATWVTERRANEIVQEYSR